jgi:hypothetical protein
MNFDDLSGPVIHVGLSAALAFLFRLNPVVLVLCGILPDIVDKPLAAMGIGGGRFIGHTLLFAVVVTGAFFLWKRKYGLAALIGLASHFVLDLNALIPWFYPFKQYHFMVTKLSIAEWLKAYFTFSRLGIELLAVLAAAVIILLGWWLYRRNRKKKKG